MRLLLCLLSVACFGAPVLTRETADLLYQTDPAVLSAQYYFARLNPSCISLNDTGAYLTDAQGTVFHVPVLMANPSGCFVIFLNGAFSLPPFTSRGYMSYCEANRTPANLISQGEETNLKFSRTLTDKTYSHALPLSPTLASSLLALPNPSVTYAHQDFARLNPACVSVDSMGGLLTVMGTEELRIPTLIVHGARFFALFNTNFKSIWSESCASCNQRIFVTVWNLGVCPFCDHWYYDNPPEPSHP